MQIFGFWIIQKYTPKLPVPYFDNTMVHNYSLDWGTQLFTHLKKCPKAISNIKQPNQSDDQSFPNIRFGGDWHFSNDMSSGVCNTNQTKAKKNKHWKRNKWYMHLKMPTVSKPLQNFQMMHLLTLKRVPCGIQILNMARYPSVAF